MRFVFEVTLSDNILKNNNDIADLMVKHAARVRNGVRPTTVLSDAGEKIGSIGYIRETGEESVNAACRV